MTPAELRAFDMVRDRITVAGFAPTIREIAETVGVTVSGAHRVVGALVDAQLLRRTPAKTRGLALVGEPDLRMASLDAIKAELARRGETLGALQRPERMAYGRKPSCRVDSCGAAVSRGHVMCRTHWFAVPHAKRDELLGAYAQARRTRSDGDARRYQDLLTDAADIAERGQR